MKRRTTTKADHGTIYIARERERLSSKAQAKTRRTRHTVTRNPNSILKRTRLRL